MGKRGPEKQYEARLELRVDTETVDRLDRLRGEKSRSEAIRKLILLIVNHHQRRQAGLVHAASSSQRRHSLIAASSTSSTDSVPIRLPVVRWS